VIGGKAARLVTWALSAGLLNGLLYIILLQAGATLWERIGQHVWITVAILATVYLATRVYGGSRIAIAALSGLASAIYIAHLAWYLPPMLYVTIALWLAALAAAGATGALTIAADEFRAMRPVKNGGAR